jgi:hypothetical protein
MMLPIHSVFDTSSASDDKENVGKTRGERLLVAAERCGTYLRFVGDLQEHACVLFAARVMAECMKNLQVPNFPVLSRTALL